MQLCQDSSKEVHKKSTPAREQGYPVERATYFYLLRRTKKKIVKASCSVLFAVLLSVRFRLVSVWRIRHRDIHCEMCYCSYGRRRCPVHSRCNHTHLQSLHRMSSFQWVSVSDYKTGRSADTRQCFVLEVRAQ